MFTVYRSKHNPIISPDPRHPWETTAAFNWSAVKIGKKFKAVYRAISATHRIEGFPDNTSIVGLAESADGIAFEKRRPFISPVEEWEKYGCEDPRITKLGKDYYIFYTALSNFPFNADGIKVAVAKTRDFKNIERHLVTPFNAKAMTLFPEKINGKLAVLLSVNTDRPPAKIGLAFFDKEEDVWNHDLWKKWYSELDKHTIDPRRSPNDHTEIGAAPIKTPAGWLVIYSHIQNYFGGGKPIFGIEALLLDLKDPKKIIGRTKGPLLVPEESYEINGYVSNVVFPSGAFLEKDTLQILYGAADTVSAKATVNIKNLLTAMNPEKTKQIVVRPHPFPLMETDSKHPWEAKAVFNPGGIALGGKIHLIYRAQSNDGTSSFGYAASNDGYRLSERLTEPIYIPRESFEKKTAAEGNSGCEDPRLTQIGDTIYMCYTAYDGKNLPQVAVSSISVENFLKKNWRWSAPKVISPSGVDDKDAFIFGEKIAGSYFLFHRIGLDICADPLADLSFKERIKTVTPIISPRKMMWDSSRIGISAPPIESRIGWIILYHGISENHHTYRVGAVLLDKKNPLKILARTTAPFLEPELPFEKEGLVPNVVFPCTALTLKDTVFIYYGGADKAIGLATVKMKDLERMFG